MNIILEGTGEGWYSFGIGGECQLGACANVQACDYTPFGTTFQNCCYYSCVSGEVTAGSSPQYNYWKLYTSPGYGDLIYQGNAPHSSPMCLLDEPFTTYYLAMYDSIQCDGWNGSHFILDIPEWNWSFDTTLTGGCLWLVQYTTGGPGCITPGMCNYNPLATIDDGSCVPIVIAQMQMYDSGNNGWGNWRYSIKTSEGETVQTGTLPAWGFGVDQFCLVPGCYEMLLHKPFGGGGSGNQVTWILQYEDGTDIISGDAPGSTDFGFSISGNQNNDCAVNTGDLLLFMGAFGYNGFCGLPDMNNDSIVNTSDLLLFMGTFGSSF
ncbi:MAG: hypothetical protein SH856_00650 [Flavobacteriales bacterium]|nr:hypothetical protein [Flavobacteriales bacterium]